MCSSRNTGWRARRARSRVAAASPTSGTLGDTPSMAGSPFPRGRPALEAPPTAAPKENLSASATPGIEVTTMAGQKEDLSVVGHTVDLGGRLGWRSPDGMLTGLYARLGWHMDATQIDQSKLAPLPSDTVTGFTVGAGLDLPRL